MMPTPLDNANLTVTQRWSVLQHNDTQQCGSKNGQFSEFEVLTEETISPADSFTCYVLDQSERLPLIESHVRLALRFLLR